MEMIRLGNKNLIINIFYCITINSTYNKLQKVVLKKADSK